MATTIKCNHCHQEIEITEAIRHELQAQVLKEVEHQHQTQIEGLKQQQQLLIETQAKELETAKQQILKTARDEAILKVRQEYDSKIESTKEEADARQKQNVELQDQIKDLFKQLRQTKDAHSQLAIDYEKKLLLEQDKIKSLAKQEAHEELSLRLAEKDKKLSDALKANEDLKRKLEQGSQQLQGEAFELAVETQLKHAFPLDEIQEVKKGQQGADIVQTVNDRLGRTSGIILWEVKNAQWQKSWLAKLREDQRRHSASLTVLVSVNIPMEYGELAYQKGIWIVSRKNIVGLGTALRAQLLQVQQERLSQDGKSEKMEELYRYLTSVEFKHRVEAIVESFNYLREDLEKEKRWFSAKWARQEKELSKIIEHTGGMHAQLQGVTGRKLIPVPALELND